MLYLPKAVNGRDINPTEALHITVFEYQGTTPVSQRVMGG